jgi:hypothetical protein
MRLRLMDRFRRSPPTPNIEAQIPNGIPPPPESEAPTFPLYRLPPELRALIYEHVFTFDSVRCQDGRWRAYEWQRSHRQRSGGAPIYHLRAFRLSTRLTPTLVSKQMRAETLHLLMTLNEMVCGNERRDVDLHYEFWMGPPLLKDPCFWAHRALEKSRPAFVSPRSVFRVHLWVYPCMNYLMRASDWRKFERAFAPLVDGGFPGKVIVTLHLVVDFQPLVCEYGQPGMRADSLPSATASLQFEYGAFEIGLDGSGLGNAELVRLFEERREVLRAHQRHDRALCQARTKPNTLSEGLRRTEEVAVFVVQMARARRAERLSLVMSGHA